MRIWLLAVALTGCIEANLVECADGRLCPAGTACDIAHDSCVAPDQLTACVGLPELASCQATGVELGRCFDGVCLPAGCGNTFLEPDELCDDGNLLGGDGCSNDCRSREVCGDGFADKLRNEQCDDGNTGGRDGCTNRCTLEAPQFRYRTDVIPDAREFAAGAWDAARGALVMVGGQDFFGTVLGDAWQLQAGSWSTLPSNGIVRRNHAMAYDPIRHQVVMFGGFSQSPQGVLLNDTWEWNGGTWLRPQTIVAPPARAFATLAWDGNRIILFGGSSLVSDLGDTWAWDGTSWMRLATANSPSPRAFPAMAFDAKRNRIVLFGGVHRNGTFPQDTWTFDGTNWAQLTTNTTPPVLAIHGMVYDAGRGVLVLSGATPNDPQVAVVWELDGVTWTEKPNASAPEIKAGAVLAYDPIRGRVVQVGGRKVSGLLGNSDEIWEWDGTAWSLRPPVVVPPPRELCAMAYDPLRGRIVMFGGSIMMPNMSRTIYADTWEWNGVVWSERAVAGPSGRHFAALEYDGTTGGVIMFGGATQTGYVGETWGWNGQVWSRFLVPGPSPRAGATLTYDVTRKRIILFGGADATQGFNDTWEWDGSAWHQVMTPTSPSPRFLVGLAYDIARGRTVLFGGQAGSATFDDTWEYDGTTWTQITTVVQPEPRSGHSAVYDRARRRVVVFGGSYANFSLWEWDGQQWSQPNATLVPPNALGMCVAYDAARHEIVMFGSNLLSGRERVTSTGSYRGDVEETCTFGIDLDSDSTTGCGDDDCRGLCEPACWEQQSCGAGPSCGDGTCNALETDRMCAQDCPAAAAICGDWYCSPGEICDADCP